jgi:DNA-binding transcriptional MerR regulator
MDKSFTIVELSERFGVTLRALRFYEGAGLLEPRRQKRMRVYSERDVECLEVILKLKKFGLTLAEIRPLIKEGRLTSASFGLTREQCIKQLKFLGERVREIEAAMLDLRELLSRLP